MFLGPTRLARLTWRCLSLSVFSEATYKVFMSALESLDNPKPRLQGTKEFEPNKWSFYKKQKRKIVLAAKPDNNFQVFTES